MNLIYNHIPDRCCSPQRKQKSPHPLLLRSIFLIIVLVIAACHTREKRYNQHVLPAEAPTSPEQTEEFAVEAPPFTEGIFPCSDCHNELEPNPTRRELDWHEEVTSIFDHDKENRWCLDCHDLNNRDSLRLASGKLLSFEESYKLCGQCHGEKLRDWRVGVHGKRTGQWNGQKHYLLCVHCHNPHAPKFEPLTPEPPPLPQKISK